MSRQVLPTAPSPTTTHLMVCIAVFYSLRYSFKICTRKKQNKKTNRKETSLVDGIAYWWNKPQAKVKIHPLGIWKSHIWLQCWSENKCILNKYETQNNWNLLYKCMPLAKIHKILPISALNLFWSVLHSVDILRQQDTQKEKKARGGDKPNLWGRPLKSSTADGIFITCLWQTIGKSTFQHD